MRPFLALCLCLFWLPSQAVADGLPIPSGPVILAVSGDISSTNGDGVARFDRAMLAELGTTRVETTTIWTEGRQSFTGTPLHALVQALGVQEGMLRATAVNDYAVDIPVSDAVIGGPILAWSRNNAPMSLRDKGPIWLVYPYDSTPAYRSEVIYSRSIWQLDRIHVTQ